MLFRSLYRVDWNLHDAVDVVFDRLLGREELVPFFVDPAQAGIERRGLAGASWARDDYNAVGLVDIRANVVTMTFTEIG